MGASRSALYLRWLRDHADLPRAYLRSRTGAARERSVFENVRNYCMFLGYARSGHSLVGSLLDAHRHAVIAHELDALRYVRMGFSRDQLYWLILDRDRWFCRQGREWTGYQYQVPGQWQGRFEELRVIGDKKGWCSTIRLGRRPSLLDALRRRVGVGLRVIHHVRNPFDNISTEWRRGRGGRTIERAIAGYFRLCRTISEILPRLDADEIVQTRHEDLVADSRAELRRLVAFIGLEASEDYLDCCARLVFPKPKQSRQEAPWTPSLIDRVMEGIGEHEYLRGYEFDG